MNREYEDSRIFSENLDRLLAGKEVKIDPAAGVELVAALDFAKKMTVLRSEPSSQFQANLKARLLQQLRDKEALQEDSGWFGRLFRGQRIWLTAAVCAALLIIVGGVLLKTGVISPPGSSWVSPPPVTSATTTATTTATATTTTTMATTTVPALPAGKYLLADASVDKPVYQPGEPVNIEVSLTNISGRSFTITQYPPILSLMSTDTRQAVYTFTAGQLSQTIPPGQKASFTLSWNQTDSKGSLVKSGNYYIELEDLDLQGKAVKLDLQKPVEFDILNPVSGGNNY
jgi:hypothetical protein